MNRYERISTELRDEKSEKDPVMLNDFGEDPGKKEVKVEALITPMGFVTIDAVW